MSDDSDTPIEMVVDGVTVLAINNDGFLWVGEELGGCDYRYYDGLAWIISQVPPRRIEPDVEEEDCDEYDEVESAIPPFVTGIRLSLHFGEVEVLTIPSPGVYLRHGKELSVPEVADAIEFFIRENGFPWDDYIR